MFTTMALLGQITPDIVAFCSEINPLEIGMASPRRCSRYRSRHTLHGTMVACPPGAPARDSRLARRNTGAQIVQLLIALSMWNLIDECARLARACTKRMPNSWTQTEPRDALVARLQMENGLLREHLMYADSVSMRERAEDATLRELHLAQRALIKMRGYTRMLENRCEALARKCAAFNVQNAPCVEESET